MGPKQSAEKQQTQQVETILISHSMFVNSKLIQVSDYVRYLKTQIRLANKQQFDEWEQRVKKVPENDSLMQPIEQSYASQGICGDSGIATITYEDYPYLLSDQIHNRKGISNKFFEQNELWYLIFTLLSSTYNYHLQGRKTGDIRPDNIFINADGHVKVASVDSWPGELTNYEKSFYEKTVTYLSPEETKDLQFGKVQEDCNKQLAETFSVGLTILDAATLTNSKDFYSKNMKFSYEKLEKKIEELRQIGYGEVLTLTIESMCEVDAEFRAKAREIFEWIHPYAEAIANLEDFEPEDYPKKLVDLVERNQKIENSNQQSQKVITSLTSQQGSAYVPENLPTPYIPTKIPTSFNQPSTILGSIGPLPSISNFGVPSSISPLSSYIPPVTTSLTYPQPDPLLSYKPPVVSSQTSSLINPMTLQNPSTSNYTLGPEGSLSYSQPQSSYVPQSYTPSSYVPSAYVPPSSLYEPMKLPAFGSTSGYTSANLESHTFALSKIDQQLEMSRKMFPE